MMRMQPYPDAGREWRIIIPVGAFSGEVHYCMRLALAKRFGGYTYFEAKGGWMSEQTPEDEDVYVFDIAVSEQHGGSLCDFAGWVRERGNQEAVHVRDADGYTIQVDEKRRWLRTPWLASLDALISSLRPDKGWLE